MNNPLDPTLRELNDCGCCAGTAVETAVAIDNRPGLGAISFRAGKYSQFKATMLALLSAADSPAMRNLKTRDDDDFTIALLDGWATVADVLTFYSERIANESFLRSATELRSIVELARSIGYELNPGVAASTWLAFTVDESLGAPGYANIDRGTKMQSIPGPDETPQVFETLESFYADKAWNSLAVKSTDFVTPYLGMKKIYLKGTTTNLNPGDALLVVGDERLNNKGSENWDIRRVRELETFPNTDAEKAYTIVTVDHGLGSETPYVKPAKENSKVYALRQRAALFGANAADWNTMPDSLKKSYLGFDPASIPPATNEWPDFNIVAISDRPTTTIGDGTGLRGDYYNGTDFNSYELTKIPENVNFDWGVGSPAANIGPDDFSVRWTGWVKAKESGAHTFYVEADDGARLWVNGQLLIDEWHAGGSLTVFASVGLVLTAGEIYAIKLEYYEHTGVAVIKLSWSASFGTTPIPSNYLYPQNDTNTVRLDAIYSGIVPQSWIVLSTPDYQEVYRVLGVAEDSPAKFALNTKSTKLTIEGENLRQKFNSHIRDTVVFAQSEELPWAQKPFYDAVYGEKITLDQAVSDLPADRELLVSGLPARVEVTDKGGALELTLADGKKLPLKVATTLSLTGPPIAQTDKPGVSRWELQMDDGKVGFLFASAEQLEFVAADASSARIFERATLERTEITSDGLARLVLTAPLTYAYDPTTTLVYANVAYATHGETTSEVLGSGDATQAHQRFVLKQTPLTYTPAANPTGGETTLEIWVNEVKWTEAETLYNRGPSERIYVVRLDDEGIVTVLFGDGESGARLPTGQENVRAVYRKGTGHEGILKADQLSLLMTRPLGVKAVTNPLAPEGAADPQELEDARENAPTTVLTLDRVVSLQDYEDFARNFSGVGKALATWTWNAHSRGLFLTVAGVAGAAISADSSTRTDLLESLLELGNPLVPIEIESYTPISFKLAGTVYVDADRVAEDVGTAVNDALKAAFSFDARSFGQPVTLSEVEAVIQNVDGVAFIDLDALYIGTKSKLEDPLAAQMPINGAAADLVFPAELLTLDETSLFELEVKTA
jgi:hypothetical protein